jgi:hypothetical protein
MPRHFSHTTAEQTVQVVEAVHVIGVAEISYIEKFCDLSNAQTANALDLALDIGLIKKSGTKYRYDSPLVRLISVPEENRKASLLRIVLESYEPFFIFRERLIATDSSDTAAQQTKAILDLDAHREEIKDTLISLGTYTNAISVEGGGKYKANFTEVSSQLKELADACNDLAGAEARIREQIGLYSDDLDINEVIRPLANALLRAGANQPAQAVNEAATAIESYLARLAQRMGVNLAGANGIGQKMDKFRTNNDLPKKTVEAGKYLAQIRNAADHGVDVDPDVGSVWVIQESTAIEYVFVACSFIKSCGARENNAGFCI